MSAGVEESTSLEKLTVAMTAFGLACVAFFLSAVVLVPATGALFNLTSIPDVVTMTVILVELLGFPIVGALFGIAIAARPIRKRIANTAKTN